jgi:lysyl-tRNA synthetase class 2
VAQPFKTHSDSLNLPLYLRIAPELFLKQAIVGGFDKVYEIGKSFRNEGIDATHNPEFTTCEFYEAYADYDKLMTTTQEILKDILYQCFVALDYLPLYVTFLNYCLQIATSVTGSHVITVNVPRKKHVTDESSAETTPVTIDFSQPFRRISVVEEIERCTGTQLPDVNDPASSGPLLALCRKFKIEVEEPFTSTRLFDALVEHFVEPQCQQPTFLCDFPTSTSPLAKPHRAKAGVVERFELFILGMEFVNAYTELNDPMYQRKQFRAQTAAKLNEDPATVKLSQPDEDFCQVLEYGLPPTGGWGLGIDRLTMLLTDHFSIKEVLLYPMMKPEADNIETNVDNKTK